MRNQDPTLRDSGTLVCDGPVGRVGNDKPSALFPILSSCFPLLVLHLSLSPPLAWRNENITLWGTPLAPTTMLSPPPADEVAAGAL